MFRLLTTVDATPALQGQTIAILGYGSQGRAHALNLRESGLDVRLGLREGGRSWTQAKEDGWSPMSFAEATEGADLVAILTPDMSQPALWHDHVKEHLNPGALLLFAHGFAIHYRTIEPPKDVDVALIAPKSPGALVRRQYEEGHGVPGLLAVHQDATGTAHARALAYADGLGCTRAGVMETTFAEETETDLFGEQAVLCGGATSLILSGWETLVEAGYQPEVAYFECLHELKLIVDLLYEGGLGRMYEFISDTAAYGDLVSGPRIIDAHAKARMKEVLDDIRSGAFAERWMADDAQGQPDFKGRLARRMGHPIESTGAKLRARMAWLAGDDDLADPLPFGAAGTHAEAK